MMTTTDHESLDNAEESGLSLQPFGRDLELGVLLVEPLSQHLVSFDQFAAIWFGLDAIEGNAEDWSVSNLDRFIKIQDSSSTSCQPFHRWVTTMLQSTAQAKTCPVEIHGQHGQVFSAELHACRLGSPTGFQLLVTIEPLNNDSDQQVPVNSSTVDSSTVDALSGLADRRALAPRLAFWHQRSPVRPFAVLFLDLNEFKQVNDRHGHAVGDRVLQTLAKRWQQCIRDDQTRGDLLVRYGGDEFVVLLSGISNCEEAKPVVMRLQAATQQPIELDGHQLILSASIGVAIAPTNGPTDLDALIASADRNMYAEKRR